MREITFENGEVPALLLVCDVRSTASRPSILLFLLLQELTEQGLPFLILFYDPDQPETKQVFRRVVEEQLLSERGVCVCVCVRSKQTSFRVPRLFVYLRSLLLLCVGVRFCRVCDGRWNQVCPSSSSLREVEKGLLPPSEDKDGYMCCNLFVKYHNPENFDVNFFCM